MRDKIPFFGGDGSTDETAAAKTDGGSATPSDSVDGATQFDRVDWDGRGGSDGRFNLPNLRPTTKLVSIFAAVITAVFLYDYFLVGGLEPTFSINSEVFGHVIDFQWNVRKIEWLFMYTLVSVPVYAYGFARERPRLARYYWQKFKQNKLALVALGVLVMVTAVGLFAPLVVSAPQADTAEKRQPPVYTSTPLFVVGFSEEDCAGEVTERTEPDGSTQRYCHGSWEHPFGTDGGGRDIMASVIYGSRVSLQVGLVPALLVTLIGTIIGAIAGYSGGDSRLDYLLMRYVDIQIVFPVFFLYLLISYLYSTGLFELVVLFAFFSWGGAARLIRSRALSEREEEYIQAAQADGASSWWIIRNHIVPNVSRIAITTVTLIVPGFILAEAGLSFIGLGDPRVSSWGQLIASGRGDIKTAWWISTIPGVALFLTVMAFNIVGDALQDALDPRQNG